MKKIIWIFGESATGKKTLIEALLNQSNNDIACQLGLENEKLKAIEKTIRNDFASFDDIANERSRHYQILDGIESFVTKDDFSVLLIKGQSNDMDERYGNTLKISASIHPEISREILLLSVYDHDILYDRIVNKDWFQADKKRYAKMFPREWLDKAVEQHRKNVYAYEELGYKITEIDSTYGYKIIQKEENENYGESSSFRR